MPWDGNGVFTPTNGYQTGSDIWTQDKDANELASAERFDNFAVDLATGLENCLTVTGETTPTANQPMGGYVHTGVGDGSALTHYASVKQVQKGALNWGGASGGSSSAYTVTLTPSPTTYAAGMQALWVPNHTNGTSSPTLAVSGLSALVITGPGGSGDTIYPYEIASGQAVRTLYDGTRHRLMEPRRPACCSISTASASNSYATAINVFDENNYASYSSTAHVTARGITYAASTGRFTFARPGLYLIAGHVLGKAGGGTNSQALVTVANSAGTLYASPYCVTPPNTGAPVPFQLLARLAAADYVTVSVVGGTGTSAGAVINIVEL